MAIDLSQRGAPGADGLSVLNSTANPQDHEGRNGDLWVNTVTGWMFAKANGKWLPKFPMLGKRGLRGLTGRHGYAFHTAAVDPVEDDGINGDSWLNTATGSLFTKDNNVWTSEPAFNQVLADAIAARDASEAAQVASELAAANSALSLAQFVSQYLGPLADDPTVDGNGDPVGVGDLYWNTTTPGLRFYNGAAWVPFNLSLYARLDGAVFTGRIETPAATAGAAGFKIEAGVAPTAPVDGDVWITSTSMYARIGGATFDLLGGAGAFEAEMLHVRDERASGNAQSLSASTWNTRVLNTVKTNQIAGASLATNQITLPAGEYIVSASARARAASSSNIGHKTRIRNITGGADLIVGDSVDGASFTGAGSSSMSRGRFALAAQSVIELQHYVSGNANGGTAVSSGLVEVYAEVQIWKVL